MGTRINPSTDSENLYFQIQCLLNWPHMSICTFTDYLLVVAEVTRGELGKMHLPWSNIVFSTKSSSHFLSVCPGYSGKRPPSLHRLLNSGSMIP